MCSLKQIKSDIKEYNGLLIDKIKKGVIEGTDIIILTNKKLEVDITRLKKFVQEKEKEKNDAISLDLAFIMDATGSMGEYLEFAKKQIISVIDSITKDSSAMVKLGFVGYKDYLEGEHKYIIFPKLTNKIEEVKNFIKSAKVEGGGDECEDMVGGLNSALNYDWESSSRFAMLIADAPCHGVQYHGMPDLDSHPDGDPKYKIDEIVQKFAEKNINLLCLNLKPTTKQLYDNFKKYFEKGKKSTSNCDIIVEEFNKEPIKLANIIVSKAKIFYEKRHDIIKGDK